MAQLFSPLIRFVRWEAKGVRGLPAREERIAKTESLFRSVNERIAEASERFDAGDNGDGEFMCECADPNCTHRIDVALEKYEDVRADGATFLLVPGHEHDDIERVVERSGRFHVVEKVQKTVRETVRRLNPRPDTA